jgi:hypothetical protein
LGASSANSSSWMSPKRVVIVAVVLAMREP